MSTSTDWASVLEDLRGKYVFLERVGVTLAEQIVPFQLIPLLQVSGSIASKLVDTKISSRTAIIFPKSCDSGKWIATLAALQLMRSEFQAGLATFAPLQNGERVVVDKGFVLEYAGTERISGEDLMRLRMSNGWYLMPTRQRMRVQPTNSKKHLSRVPPPRISGDLLDAILDTGALGNRSIFSHCVLLVSALGRSKLWARRRIVSSQLGGSGTARLLDLFQWAGSDLSGQVTNWGAGQFSGRPVLIVTPDIPTAQTLATNGNGSGVRLVVVDGGAGVSRDVASVDALLDRGVPLLVVADADDYACLDLLRNRRFEFWSWTKDDLDDATVGVPAFDNRPGAPDPFGTLKRALENYRRSALNVVSCADPTLEAAAGDLFRLEGLVRKDQDEPWRIIDQLFGIFTRMSRLLRPRYGPESREFSTLCEHQLAGVEALIAKDSVWLSSEFTEQAIRAASRLRGVLRIESGPKVRSLAEYIERVPPSQRNGIGIILARTDEVDPTVRYWVSRFPDAVQPTFLSLSTFTGEEDFESIVVCGWLGSERMRKVLHSYAAPCVTLLVNGIERGWLGDSQRKWRRIARVVKPSDRTSMLGIRATIATPEQEPEVEALPSTTPEAEEFELRLRMHRRQLLASEHGFREEEVSSVYIELSGGYAAFLEDDHYVPVVTRFVTTGDTEGEIPQSTVSELKVGDFLLFHERTESNLIRQVADQGLAKSGKAHLRAVASLWHTALRDCLCHLNGRMSELVAALRANGCHTSVFTIRHWVRTDVTIGPRREEDLAAIANATKHPELQAKLYEVKIAIREVRGAHLQASSFLVNKLLSAAPSRLSRSTGAALTIEIEGVGRAVVAEIESIDSEHTPVAVSRANRLLKREPD